MIAPKCRICGMREHGHVCQGGTAADRVRERRRLSAVTAEHEVRKQIEHEIALASAVRQASVVTPAAPMAAPARPPARAMRRWHTEDGNDGEPIDVLDAVAPRKPARFYAPQGQCKFCDRRRAAARKSMQAVRERGEA